MGHLPVQKLRARLSHFPDNQLFPNDGKVYLCYDGEQVRRLNAAFSGVQRGGGDKSLFARSSIETGLLEGNFNHWY